MRRLEKHGDIVIRSDGLSAIAGAAWQRVIHDVPSDKIKENLLYGEKLPSQMTVFLGNKKIPVSGIEDNNMQLKTDIKSWHPFFDKHNACIEESVLLDDSKNNIKVAQQLGMTAVHISKLDSFLEKSSTEPLLSQPSAVVESEEKPLVKEEEKQTPVVEGDETEEEEAPAEILDDESYFTETLAKIYVKQQRYSKAIEIIRRLNLKYPKKNAYFADQIRFLEKLIINAKSK